jgi:hypothetical protein
MEQKKRPDESGLFPNHPTLLRDYPLSFFTLPVTAGLRGNASILPARPRIGQELRHTPELHL